MIEDYEPISIMSAGSSRVGGETIGLNEPSKPSVIGCAVHLITMRCFESLSVFNNAEDTQHIKHSSLVELFKYR